MSPSRKTSAPGRAARGRGLRVLRVSRCGRLRRAANEPGSGDILALRTGDTTLTPLINSAAGEGNPALSPDGRWLAYSSDESGNSEVYVRPFPDVASARW